jgi:nicotinamide riboside transporter PnuC
MEIIAWIAVAMSIVGTLFNSHGKRVGFYYWIVGNFYWIAYNFVHQTYAQGFLFVFYFFANIYGLWHWKKSGIK